MKTDLSKILSISGKSGLYLYITQSKVGLIAENLEDKKRQNFPLSSKVTSLADVSIYTDVDETKLQQVFLKLKEVLGEKDAPSGKSDPEVLKELFEEALPNYDRARFYVSHMKKVVDWYNCLKNHASLDFVDPEEETEAETGA